MKFIVSSTALLKQLQLLQGVLASSNTLPILDNFLFEIDGKQLSLRPDPAQTRETATQWLERTVLPDDPRRKLGSFPAGVRSAIQSARLVKGMTREQVIMAIGYPHLDDKKGLDAPSWRYWWSSFESFYVHWSRDKLSKN